MPLQTQNLMIVFHLFFIHRVCATLDALKTLGYDWKHVLMRFFYTQSVNQELPNSLGEIHMLQINIPALSVQISS